MDGSHARPAESCWRPSPAVAVMRLRSRRRSPHDRPYPTCSTSRQRLRRARSSMASCRSTLPRMTPLRRAHGSGRPRRRRPVVPSKRRSLPGTARTSDSSTTRPTSCAPGRHRRRLPHGARRPTSTAVAPRHTCRDRVSGPRLRNPPYPRQPIRSRPMTSPHGCRTGPTRRSPTTMNRCC